MSVHKSELANVRESKYSIQAHYLAQNGPPNLGVTQITPCPWQGLEPHTENKDIR